MTLEELTALDKKIASAIERMPPADPLAVSRIHEGEHESPIRDVIRRVCAGAPPLVQQRIESEYFGIGPLGALFDDPEVTEIIVNGRASIWFEKNGKLSRHEDAFLSPLSFRNFIARMSREAGVEASLSCPFADGRWRDCRMHLIIPPAAGPEAIITMRRHPPSPWTFASLLERSWASEKAIEELRRLVSQRSNFLIVGGTGSGKTSVLNACLREIEGRDRALIIEDTDELARPNDVSAKLLTRRDTQGLLREIDQSELLKQALRMRPDRIVMGEIRGGEAKDLLMAFATGHAGCMGTLHADSARQALLRLEMLIQLGAPQWSLHAVRTLIWLSLQAIVVVGRREDGSRALEGVYKIASLEELGFLIEKVR